MLFQKNYLTDLLTCTQSWTENLTIGVFLMKLTYENKLKIYELRKNGMSWSQLNQKCGVSLSNLKYMVKLMDPYDLEKS